MNAIRFKPGVELNGLEAAGVRILAALDAATQFFRRDITVTCGTDSHPPGDPHTRGCAIDARTSDWPPAAILELVPWLRGLLGSDFTVLYEVPTTPPDLLVPIAYVNPGASAGHIHLQLKKGFGPYPPPGPDDVTGPVM